MINIDTRLLPEVTPDQLFLLCHIVNFMNENRMCFPSNKKLIEQSGFSDSKILRVKNELVSRKIISVKQRFRADGSQTSNLYKIETEFIGVFVTGKNMSNLDISPFTNEEGGVFTHKGGTPSPMKPLEVLPNSSINQNKVLNKNLSDFTSFEKITIHENYFLQHDKQFQNYLFDCSIVGDYICYPATKLYPMIPVCQNFYKCCQVY